jgi:hypothetical protein
MLVDEPLNEPIEATYCEPLLQAPSENNMVVVVDGGKAE